MITDRGQTEENLTVIFAIGMHKIRKILWYQNRKKYQVTVRNSALVFIVIELHGCYFTLPTHTIIPIVRWAMYLSYLDIIFNETILLQSVKCWVDEKNWKII